ncbi:hypothetical protein DPMN_074166 [Dreissena polymorpha]|nr:hypothetical protein DPMN_074166 [Dreissena polymorpha]
MDYTESVVPFYDDMSFRRKFRMSKGTFHILSQYLKDLPEFSFDHPGGKEHVSVEKQLLMTLWYLGSCDTIDKMGDRFGISTSSVIRCRNRILAAVNRHLKRRFIVWPNAQKIPEVEEHFGQRNGFPGIIGALDGSHIEIKKPTLHGNSYINRKGYASLQVQAVCTDDMLFIHIFTGYPGSCHDARILRNSDLWQNGPNLCGENHIIADAAYPTRKWLLTPYRDNGHLNAAQKKYNKYHSSCRVVIERAFALLKGRFRRLKYIDASVKTAVIIIMCSCIFHNICLINHDDVNEFLEDADMLDPVLNPICVHDNYNDEGVRKRDLIAAGLI